MRCRRRQAADARNCVFMGTSVVNGSGRAVVFATGLATEFGRIYRLTAEMPREDSPLQREVTVMARRVAVVAIAAGIGLFAIRASSAIPWSGRLCSPWASWWRWCRRGCRPRCRFRWLWRCGGWPAAMP